ncbi:MAG: enoyl-CoA hydratase/isomerase family protein [Planctomycetota bacterium]|jgi:methylglutaconyl-CoA hydratase
MTNLINTTREGGTLRIELNDPEHRNALSSAMFDALEEALRSAAGDDEVRVLLLHGRGRAFSAGFDLTAALDDPQLLGAFILRLSGVCRSLRRMSPVVVAAAHGAAIAGGCALLSACDLVVVAPDAKIGYPVHRIGLSPAVSAPTLASSVGPGATRWMQLGGELIDGREAHRIGLASHLAASSETLLEEASTLCRTLCSHGRHALRVTKAWLNELDGSMTDDRFRGPAEDTAREAMTSETVQLLRRVWSK